MVMRGGQGQHQRTLNNAIFNEHQIACLTGSLYENPVTFGESVEAW